MYSLFPLTSMFSISLSVKCDVNISWLIEPMKTRPSVNSSIAGNSSMNCWVVNRTVMHIENRIEIFLSIVKIFCIYCIVLYWFYNMKWLCITNKIYKMTSCMHVGPTNDCYLGFVFFFLFFWILVSFRIFRPRALISSFGVELLL